MERSGTVSRPEVMRECSGGSSWKCMKGGGWVGVWNFWKLGLKDVLIKKSLLLLLLLL